MKDYLIPIVTAIAGFLGGAGLDLFRHRDEWGYATAAKRQLKSALSETDQEWRTFERLSHIAGSPDDQQLRKWLIQIGARRSGDGQDLWTMRVEER